MNKPTGHELNAARWEDNEEYVLVDEHTEPDDHGYMYHLTFRRPSDDTYWTTYGVSHGAGDYDTLRDDPHLVDVWRTYPHTVTTTVYKTTPPA